MSERYPNLLSPIRIGNLDVRNRIVSSAYQTNLGEGYRPTERLIEYHVTRARGGVGLIVLEGIRVHPTTRPARYNLIGWEEESLDGYRRLVDSAHQHGAKVIAQLLHLGRAANPMETRLPIWSASQISAPAVFGLNTSVMTHAMTVAEIEEISDWYARCASNMVEAGFDGIEIHAGHGYLIQQFLSPLTNFRDDEYGGTLRNRARFASKVTESVSRAISSDKVLGIRISADELVDGGLTTTDTTQFARWLEESGKIDYISVSHSTTVPASHARQIADMSFPAAPFVKFATEVKQVVRSIPIFTVCRITDPDIAESIISEGKADLVCMARAHIADPEFGLKLSQGRESDIRHCIGCNQGCAGRINAGQPVGCLVNAEAGRELELGPVPHAATARSVVVVGGGVAGMEAARVAALRGHSVTLYEQKEELGGQVQTLVKAPSREDFGKIVVWLQEQLAKLEVRVVMSTMVDKQLLESSDAEAVVLATGSIPVLPTLPGLGTGGISLATPDDVLEGRVLAGPVVVLLDGDGHHKAASTAEYLAEKGSKVHLVTRAESVSPEITSVSRTLAIERLVDRGVIMHTSCWFDSARQTVVELTNTTTGGRFEVPDVSLVVAALPNRPSTVLEGSLEDLSGGVEIRVVGDCVAPRRALEAIEEGYLAGRAL